MVHDYWQCDEISEQLTVVKEKTRFLQREFDLLQKKDRKAKWYQKNKITKQFCTSSDTSDGSLLSSSAHCTINLSQSSQECSKPKCSDFIDLSEPGIDQEISRVNPMSLWQVQKT